jgi:hypothetical protein
MLIDIDIGVLDELTRHISSLRRFLNTVGNRDSKSESKTRKRRQKIGERQLELPVNDN